MTTPHENRQFEEKDEMSVEKNDHFFATGENLSLVLSDNRALYGKKRQ